MFLTPAGGPNLTPARGANPASPGGVMGRVRCSLLEGAEFFDVTRFGVFLTPAGGPNLTPAGDPNLTTAGGSNPCEGI